MYLICMYLVSYMHTYNTYINITGKSGHSLHSWVMCLVEIALCFHRAYYSWRDQHFLCGVATSCCTVFFLFVLFCVNFQPQHSTNKMWGEDSFAHLGKKKVLSWKDGGIEEKTIQIYASTEDKWQCCRSLPIKEGQLTLLFLGYCEDSLRFVMCLDIVRRTTARLSRKWIILSLEPFVSSVQ